ncbi:MAG: transglycosylase SLT domain-containing protein, partial [Gammaproteobacteria bacterium]|nr:transglycosylase SLT domain-containing protein [Gammaproteobacteria bacterium]
MVARDHNIDASLIKAMVQAESAFNPVAVSPEGARGLMQLMPNTASQYAVS